MFQCTITRIGKKASTSEHSKEKQHTSLFAFLNQTLLRSGLGQREPTPTALQPLGGVGRFWNPKSFATSFLSDPSQIPRFVPSPRQLPSAGGPASARVPAPLLPLHCQPSDTAGKGAREKTTALQPRQPQPGRTAPGAASLRPSQPAAAALPAPGRVCGSCRRPGLWERGGRGAGRGRGRAGGFRCGAQTCPAGAAERQALPLPARNSARPGAGPAAPWPGPAAPKLWRSCWKTCRGTCGAWAWSAGKNSPPSRRWVALSRVKPGRAGLSRAADAVPEGPPWPRGPAGAELPACPCSSTQPVTVPGELRPPRPRAVPRRVCACRVFCGCCFQCAVEAGAVDRTVPLGERGWRTDWLLTGEAGAAPRRPPGKTQSSPWLSRHHRASETGWRRARRWGLAAPACGHRASGEPDGLAEAEEGRAQPRPALRLLWEPRAPQVSPRVCALPLSRRVWCPGWRRCLIPHHCTPVAAGVRCAGRSSSLPRRFGLVWLSNGVGTTEKSWETQKFGLLLFSPFLKIPLINSFQ